MRSDLLTVTAAQHGEVSHQHPGPHQPPRPRRTRAGGNQDEPVHPPRPGERQGHRDPPAHRDAEQVSAGQIQPVHQARDVGGHLLDRVRARRFRRAARASVVDRDDTEPVGQRPDQHAHLRHIQAKTAE